MFCFIEKPFDEDNVRKNILKALDVPLAEEEDRIVFYRKDGIAFSMSPDEIYYIDIREALRRILVERVQHSCWRGVQR